MVKAGRNRSVSVLRSYQAGMVRFDTTGAIPRNDPEGLCNAPRGDHMTKFGPFPPPAGIMTRYAPHECVSKYCNCPEGLYSRMVEE